MIKQGGLCGRDVQHKDGKDLHRGVASFVSGSKQASPYRVEAACSKASHSGSNTNEVNHYLVQSGSNSQNTAHETAINGDFRSKRLSSLLDKLMFPSSP